MIKPTPKELELLRAIDMSEYGDNIMDPIWTWNAWDNIETLDGQITEASMGGIIASAGKKGLIDICIEDDADDNCIGMTEAGFTAYIESIGRENINKWYDKSDLTDQLAIDAATRLENA